MIRTLLLLALPVLFAALAVPAAAGPLPAVLTGTVTDAETGDVLIGATVRIEGTSLGDATDLLGEYRIARAPSGPQTVIVTYIGYREQRVEVNLPEGGTQELDIALELDVIEGEGVEITAQAEGQVAAINQQLQSNQIVSVVSAARLQELPDANAAESVGRLPGISIQRDAGEGQNVVIRGLSPKYNNVTVNGVKLPSTSFDTRATDLGSISSEMLAGVEVYKSITPDQDADAIGGSVNFRLQGAPDRLRTRALIQGGYNDLTGSFGQYKANASASNRFLSDRLGVFVQGNLERADRSSERITADYLDQANSDDANDRTLLIDNVDLRNRAETRDRYGASLILDYRLPVGAVQLTNFVSRLDRDYVSRDNTYGPVESEVTYDIRDAQLQTDVLSTALSGNFDLGEVAELDVTLNRSVSVLETPYDSRARFRENSAFIADSLVRDQGPQAVPEAARGDVDNTFFERLDFSEERGRERDLGAQANLKVPFALGSWVSGFVKTGGKYRSKHRNNDNTQRYLHLYYGGEIGGLDELASLFPDAQRSAGGQVGLRSFVDEANSGQDILGGDFQVSQTPLLDLARRTQSELDDQMIQAIWGDFQDFDVVEDVLAGYVMTELNFGPRVLLLPGIRYERTNTSYEAFFGRVPQIDTGAEADQVVLRDTSSEQSYGNWFPMVQLRVRPTDWFDVRVAYTQTQARPDLDDTSPQLRIRDAGSGLITKGSPGLRPAQAQNVDAYLSFYSNRIGLFSVGAFYKRIEGVIYQADIQLQDESTAAANGYAPEFVGYRVLEPRNLDSPTTVRGIEVDWQANLLWLPGVLNGVVFNANVSRIFSDTEIQRVQATTVAEPPFFIPVTTFTNVNQEVRLIDQPDWVANLSLGYDRGPFSGRASVLYQKGNLTGYGNSDRTLSFFDTYVRWDAQASYRVLPSLSLFAQLNNLSNRPDVALQSTGRFLSEEEVYGRSFNLGLRFRP
ncbi:TonB-dependent receptor [Rubrivirga sp. S365]|uniref:TonB-dependent receptor n=1 Tax=Rubrivirga sp. S365 TaxID=3076080 RepID=UPI0028C7CB86|nr:TonB-dependent receptor [Rubrivirga sp. S365]MDT7856555.1 TonB-dependent receptor [Rubrivirga sp. S365]